MAAFKPGESGNPNGKPKGTPHRLTAAMRAQIADGADPIGLLQRVARGEAIEVGKPHEDGSRDVVTPTLEQMIRAASKLTDKLVPDAKDGALHFDIGEIASPKDALAALGRVAKALGEGAITPSEAQSVNDVINSYLKTYEVHELDTRLRALEEGGGAR
jgi:hypothetical protein